MAISPVAAAKRNDQLHEQFQHLQDDWNSYKDSVPQQRRRRRRHRHHRHHSCSTTTTTANDSFADVASARVASLTPDHLLEFLDQSPKKLLSSLQKWQPPPHSPPLSLSSEPSQGKEEEGEAATEFGLDGEVEFSSVSSSSELIQVAPQVLYYSSCSSNAASSAGNYLASCSSPEASSSEEDGEAEEANQKIVVASGGRLRKIKMMGMGLLGAISLMAMGLGLISYVRELITIEEHDYIPPT